MRRLIAASLAPAAVLLLVIVPGPSGAAGSKSLTLTKVTYDPPSGPGQGCNAPLPSGGSGSASYDDPGGAYNDTWEFKVPTTMAAGATANTKVSVKSNNNGGASASITLRPPAEFGVNAGARDQIDAVVPVGAPGSDTDQEAYTFNPNREFTAGEKLYILVGHACVSYVFEYTADPPPAATPTPTATTAPVPKPPMCPRARARAAAVNEVRVVAVQPGAEVHKAGTPDECWVPITKDMVLQQGDEISTDPDGAVTVQFADQSTFTLFDTTQFKIASFFTEGGVVKTEVLLLMGRVRARVRKVTEEDLPPIVTIKSGKDHNGSVRGTVFDVEYDPGADRTRYSVLEGTVAVRNGGKEVLVGAGKEVVLTRSKTSKLAKIGKAGLRGGISASKALAKVMKLVARANGPCGITLPRVNAYAVKEGAKKSWGVAIKVVGKRKGTARWTVKGSKTKAGNALAKAIVKQCK